MVFAKANTVVKVTSTDAAAEPAPCVPGALCTDVFQPEVNVQGLKKTGRKNRRANVKTMR